MSGSAEARAAEDITWPKLRPGIVSIQGSHSFRREMHVQLFVFGTSLFQQPSISVVFHNCGAVFFG